LTMAGDTSDHETTLLNPHPARRHLAVLICYVPADQSWAEWMSWQLTTAGFEPMIEAWAPPGSNVVSDLDLAIRKARQILVLLSPEATATPQELSGWMEAFRADPHGLERRLIPVIVKACRPEGLLGSIVPIKLSTLDEHEARVALLAGIEAAASGSAKPRTPPRYPGPAGGPEIPPPEFPGVLLPAVLTDFLDRVAEAYRDRHPGASVSRAVAPDGLRYLEISDDNDRMRRPRPIGVCPDDLGDDFLDRFINQVHAAFEKEEQYGESDLIYGGTLSNDEIPRRARRRGVQVHSVRAIENGWDPAGYQSRQAAKLAADSIYPPDLYVPQRFVRFDDSPEAPPRAHVFNSIVDWLDARDPRLILVLADFGHGKTFLTRELARRIPELLPRLTPMLISLRTYEKSHVLDTVLAVHLQESDEDGVPVKAVRRMLDRGNLLLIFDGFDELAARLTYDVAAEHLQMILSAVSGHAKVLLTSRTQHFASDQQWLTELGEKVHLRPAARIVRLAGFDDSQILDFLTRHYTRSADATLSTAPAEAARRRMELLGGITNLRGLSSTPRMLAFIADLPHEDLIAAQSTDGMLTQSDLYRTLVDKWLQYEASRHRPTIGAQPSLDAEQLRRAATAIALQLWESDEEGLELPELAAVIYRALPGLGPTKLEPAEALFAIGSGSLLVRDDTDRFSFVHSSVREYLVAVVVAEQINSSGGSSLAGACVMSGLIVDFLVGAATSQALEQWAHDVLTGPDQNSVEAAGERIGPDGSSVVRKNALAVASRIGMPTEPLNLTRQDLRWIDLSGRDLRFAKLRGANLAGVRLIDVNLTGADLRDADLSGAYLLRPHLHRTRLAGSRWHRAVLLDPKLDTSTGEAVELAQAAVTGRDSIQSMLLPPASGIHALAWSPDGSLLASAWGSYVVLTTAGLRPIRTFAGHIDAVAVVAFTPDGEALASVGRFDGTVRLRKVATGEQIHLLSKHRGVVTAVAFAPDGHTLATGYRDGTVRLWEIATGNQLRIFTGHYGTVNTVAFTRDGNKIASGGDDGTICIWQVATGFESTIFDGHRNPVLATSFSPDGQSIAGATDDGRVRLWNIASGQETHTFFSEAELAHSLDFTPDGQILACGGGNATNGRGSIRLWATDSGQLTRVLNGHRSHVTTVSFSPTGQTLASGGHDGTIRIWEVAAGRQTREIAGRRGPVHAAVFSPDGDILATGGGYGDRTIRMWHADTGRQADIIGGHTGAVHTIAFSPDGQTVASSGDYSDGSIQLWHAATGRPKSVLSGHSGAIVAMSFSPDGQILASVGGYGDRTVRLWHWATGQQIHVLGDRTGPVHAVAFLPDGETLTTADGNDGTIHLWNVTAGQQTQQIILGHGPVKTAAFSPGGRTLAVGFEFEGTVRLHETKSGQDLGVFQGHIGPVHGLAFTPDGKFLASGGHDGTVRLWSTRTKQQIHLLSGHAGPVRAISFSPTKPILASASDDGTVRLWSAESGDLIATLVGLASNGWAALLPDGSYKLVGDAGEDLWWAIKTSRFAPGELDAHVPAVYSRPPESIIDL